MAKSGARPDRPIRLKKTRATHDRSGGGSACYSRRNADAADRFGGDRAEMGRKPAWSCCDRKAKGQRSPTSRDWEELRYSTDYGNAETDFTLGELTPKHFSFNSHLGACPACHGLGTELVCRSGSDDFRSDQIARRRRDHAMATRHKTDAGLLPAICKARS